jgi:hypothetical protein
MRWGGVVQSTRDDWAVIGNDYSEGASGDPGAIVPPLGYFRIATGFSSWGPTFGHRSGQGAVTEAIRKGLRGGDPGTGIA